MSKPQISFLDQNIRKLIYLLLLWWKLSFKNLNPTYYLELIYVVNDFFYQEACAQ